MTDRAPPPAAGSVGPEELAQEFMRYRPRLMAIAYRMLGSAWDAEDVVAEAMVRWLGVDRAEVREPVAFLTTVVTRLALDQLRSARARRERYVGPWLPEPVLTAASVSSPTGGAPSASGPLDVLERREAASLATLRMMEALTPPERAVLVLHDAFDTPHPKIAETGPGSAAQAAGRRDRPLPVRRSSADSPARLRPARRAPRRNGRATAGPGRGSRALRV